MNTRVGRYLRFTGGTEENEAKTNSPKTSLLRLCVPIFIPQIQNLILSLDLKALQKRGYGGLPYENWYGSNGSDSRLRAVAAPPLLPPFTAAIVPLSLLLLGYWLLSLAANYFFSSFVSLDLLTLQFGI